MNRRTTTTAATAASALLLLLLAGCGGHTSDDAAPAAAEPAAATSTPAARPTTPSATPTTEAAVPGQVAVEAQVKHALAAAKAPGRDSLQVRACVVNYVFVDVGRHYPHFREDVVAALHAAGWKTGPGGGPGETALTNADGWQVFVDQQDMGKLNGTGSPTRELSVKAYCR